MPEIKSIDEREWVAQFRSKNLCGFYKWVEDYEQGISNQMRIEGWKHGTTDSRTVTFTFGEVTFTRRGYTKNGVWRYPVDEKLGLIKRSHHSTELIYQVAKLATMLPYRQVVDVIELMYSVYITKDTVMKAIKMVSGLYTERDEYRFYEEEKESGKIKADIIYLEGDGVMLHSSIKKDQFWSDLAHFVVHTGSEYGGGIKRIRRQLKNKFEVINLSRQTAIDQMTAFITNNFEIDENTILITNSDMGTGYGSKVFEEIAFTLGISRHEHFYDEYHLNKDIKRYFRRSSDDLIDDMFSAIKKHDKKKVRLILDTAESRISAGQESEQFHKFRNKLLTYFKFTAPAKHRGLSHKAIGIMESQHRKVTYRMKHRGMYWGFEGLGAMSRMLISNVETELRELFFGDWRNEYSKYKNLPENLSEFLSPVHKDYEPPRGTVRLPRLIRSDKYH